MRRRTSDLRWSIADRLSAAFVALGMLATLFWALVTSEMFIRTVSMTVQDDQIHFVRELPFGTVSARWRSEITLINGDGFECNSGEWKTATYQPIAGNTVIYRLGEWADDCLTAGPPFYLTTVRSVQLFGLIPLRPSTTVTEVHGDRQPGDLIFIPREE